MTTFNHKILTRVFRTLIFLALPFIVFGQNEVTFTATPDVKRITENEYFQVTFTITNADWERFTPPKFGGFNQVGNPMQSQSSSIINGKRSFSKSLIYNVLTKKAGRYVIPPATAIVNGKEIKSNSFTIEVVKGRKKPDSATGVEDQFFVVAEPSTTTARVGEQIIVDYKLYTLIDVESYDLGQDPEYNGFFAQDIRRVNYRVMREEVDGEMYLTKIFKRIALFPQQAGVLSIEPLNIRLGITDDSNRRRNLFFNEVKYVPYQVDSVLINVVPFPTDSLPPFFSGAVGKYQMAANMDKRIMTTDEAMTITMSIQGNGDIKRVQAPDLNLGDDFEVYDPNVLEEKTYEDGGQIIGRKVLEYQVIPRNPGRFIIEPKLTYFDTDSLKFMTLVSEGIVLDVKKGNKKKGSSISQKGVEAQPVLLPNKDETTLSKKGKFFLGSPFFWVLTILPFVFLGGAFVYRQQQIKKGSIDITLVKSQKAERVAVKKLAEAEKLMLNNDSKNFYDEISKALFGYVCDKLTIPFSELSKANISEKLNSLQVSQSHIDDFIQLVKTCEMALYAGMDNSAAMQETYSKAREVIVKIEEELT